MLRPFVRRPLLHRAFLLGGALLVLPSCGGSASETPWPVEPDNVDLGPVGESRAEEAGTAMPSDSSSPRDRAEPAMEDTTVTPRAQPLAP